MNEKFSASAPVHGESIREVFGKNGDFESRKIRLGGNSNVCAELFFIDGLISGESVSREIIAPLTDGMRFCGVSTSDEACKKIMEGAAFDFSAKAVNKLGEAENAMLTGFCILVFSDGANAVALEAKSKDGRSVSEPTVEKSVKGPKEAFTENIRRNTAMLRRKIRDSALIIEEMQVGGTSHTKVSLVYVRDVTDSRLVDAMRAKLETIKTDVVISAANLEEHIAGNYKTPFPQLISTERPDKMAIGLMEGRVGVLADGLPLGFLAPANFTEFFRVPEDNAGHFIIASALTILRYVALFISVFVPAVYVAAEMYHQEMIPTKLMLSIIESKQDVPFSTAAEVLGMLVIFEILQEAGLRLPQSVGETVSIIGGLVVGQSAVEAKVVSPIVVIVVAMAGITGYTVPDQGMSAAIRLCRLGAVLLALVLGFFGVIIGLMLIIYHLCTLENLGVAYMAPLVDGNLASVMREMLRFPLRNSKQKKAYLRPDGGVNAE